MFNSKDTFVIKLLLFCSLSTFSVVHLVAGDRGIWSFSRILLHAYGWKGIKEKEQRIGFIEALTRVFACFLITVFLPRNVSFESSGSAKKDYSHFSHRSEGRLQSLRGPRELEWGGSRPASLVWPGLVSCSGQTGRQQGFDPSPWVSGIRYQLPPKQMTWELQQLPQMLNLDSMCLTNSRCCRGQRRFSEEHLVEDGGHSVDNL